MGQLMAQSNACPDPVWKPVTSGFRLCHYDYTILYYTILYYTILYYTILYYTTLCYPTNLPGCAALRRAAPVMIVTVDWYR